MGSRLFPDSGSRLCIESDGDWAISKTITYYADKAGTLAEVYRDSGTASPAPGDALTGSSNSLDSYGRQVDFRGPLDGTRKLYAKVGASGPLFEVYAAPEEDLVDLDERVTALEPGGSGAAATAANLAAETSARTAGDTAAVGVAAALAIVLGG